MFKVISSICEKGSADFNEDSILVSDNYLAVIDGATGLNGIHLTQDGSDAAWLSRRLCELLKDGLSNLSIAVPETLKSAASTIKAELDNLGYNKFENSYPSAGVAIVRQKNDNLECFTLGDTPILLLYKDKSVKCFCDDSLVKLDDTVIKRMVEIHDQTGCTILEARKQVNDILIENRMKMNHKGGYYIFEPSGAGIDFIKSLSVPKADIEAVALMTDGYYAVLSCYDIITDPDKLMQSLLAGKAHDLLNSLKELAYEDNDLNRYPRFKVMDDATVIAAKLVEKEET